MRVLALAAEAGRERFAHLEAKPFLHGVGHPLGRGHALVKYQLQLGRWRQAAIARQRDKGQRVLRGIAVPAMGFEQCRALFALDQAHRNALAKSVHSAPHVRLYTGQTGRAGQAQREVLLFIHGAVGVGHDRLHKRPAGAETESVRPVEINAFCRLQTRLDLHAAAHTGRQIVLEIKNPGAFVQPAPGALGCDAIGAKQIHRRLGFGGTKNDGGFVKFKHHLPNPCDLTLRRQAGNLERLCRNSAQGQQGGDQQGFGTHGMARKK